MNDIKVLIVDDEIEFAESLIQRLGRRGFSTRAAVDAVEAVEILDQGWIPDVAILDLQMPKHDGLAVMEMIKARSSAVQFLMLTGHPSASSSIEGMSKGLFEYLVKPVPLDVLIERIEAACGE